MGELTIGVDVGGTKIAGGVVDGNGVVVSEHRVESPATDVEAIEDAIVEVVDELTDRHRVGAVGIGAAGYVDADRAMVLFAPNLAWRDLDLKGELEERIDVPVIVENDANAAAWGEFRFGAGEDVDDLLMLTIGTGVGGGIVIDGLLRRGAFGIGGEVGHIRMVPGGTLCGCGNRGCLEAYGSGSALVREARAEAAGGSLLAKRLLDLAGGDPAEITGPMITELAQEGDSFCLEQLATLGRWIGEGIATLSAVLDPAVTVIGGGVGAAGDLLLGPIRSAYAESVTGRGYRPIQEIRPARLGNRAGIIGAADLARIG